jgi:hypothetical protein
MRLPATTLLLRSASSVAALAALDEDVRGPLPLLIDVK